MVANRVGGRRAVFRLVLSRTFDALPALVVSITPLALRSLLRGGRQSALSSRECSRCHGMRLSGCDSVLFARF